MKNEIDAGSRTASATPVAFRAIMRKQIGVIAGAVCLVFGGMLALGRQAVTAESSPEIHDFHVSYTRLAVEGNFAVCNIRFFKDDLQEGLQAYSESTDFFLDVSPNTDALFLKYLNDRFEMKVGDQVLSASLIGSGEDFEGKEDIWWYTLQFEAPDQIDAIHLTNSFLIDHFEDQKNIVKVQHFPSEKTFSYYFDDEDTQFEIEL